MRISDWSSDVCSSDLGAAIPGATGIDIDVGGTGSLNILTSVSLYADARAFGGGASGGALRAGRINIAAHDGGSFAIAEDLFATADAYGFAAYPGSSSEERPVGKEWFSTCRSRWSPYH